VTYIEQEKQVKSFEGFLCKKCLTSVLFSHLFSHQPKRGVMYFTTTQKDQFTQFFFAASGVAASGVQRKLPVACSTSAARLSLLG
jgi:hypothetical protein